VRFAEQAQQDIRAAEETCEIVARDLRMDAAALLEIDNLVRINEFYQRDLLRNSHFSSVRQPARAI
jgi:hypothetical protein